MHSLLTRIDKNNFSFRIKGNIEEISYLEGIIEGIGLQWNLNEKIKFKLNLVLEEVLSNVIFHGFESVNENNYILSELELSNNEIQIRIIDNAKEFNPLLKESEPANKPIEEQSVGGLGIHLVKNMTVFMKYNRKNELNQLTLSITLLDGN